jgi:hypothetical protein
VPDDEPTLLQSLRSRLLIAEARVLFLKSGYAEEGGPHGLEMALLKLGVAIAERDARARRTV